MEGPCYAVPQPAKSRSGWTAFLRNCKVQLYARFVGRMEWLETDGTTGGSAITQCGEILVKYKDRSKISMIGVSKNRQIVLICGLFQIYGPCP